MQRAVIILHEGFEEMEAVAPIDLLSRAGVELTLARVQAGPFIRGRSGIVLEAPTELDALNEAPLFDAVILPGGPAVKALRKHTDIMQFLRKHHTAGKILAGICAAPLLLLDAGLLPEHYTAHPSAAPELPQADAAACIWHESILTSQGAGTATEFALALVEALTDEETMRQIAGAICWRKA